MLSLPSEKVIALIDSVLAKHKWTQDRLSKELNVGPEKISRWRSGTKMHQWHFDELKRLESDIEILPKKPEIPQIKIPFTFTISRESLRISTDKNGNFIVDGTAFGKINKEAK